MNSIGIINKKKYFIGCILIVLFAVLPLIAQVSANPNDPFYQDASAWETLGLVPNLPPLKPYPIQLVKSILETVIQDGDARQQAQAQAHFQRIFGKKIRFGIEISDSFKLTDTKADFKTHEITNQYAPALVAYGNIELPFYLAGSFNVIPFVTNTKYGEEITPVFKRPEYDFADDALVVGSFNQFTEYNAVASVGTPGIWFQAGLSRSSWGAFSDGVVLGPQAPHTANFNFVVNREKWNYTLSMFVLSASDAFGRGNQPGKFMTMHSLEVSLFRWLDFTVYENSIFGPRFTIAYLAPIAPFMSLQQITGFDYDNLQLGIQFEVKPIQGFVWATNIFTDDIGFNDLVKLRLNTKLKLAAQSGIKFAPKDSVFSFLSADYMLIAPYMYSHSQYERVNESTGAKELFRGGSFSNYQNYTSNGASLGSNLPPNSDKVSFNTVCTPFPSLRINIGGSLIRHSNINESLPDEYAAKYVKLPAGVVATDGSVFNYPDASDGYFDYAQHNFMFMSQPTKMYIYKIDLSAEYDLPLAKNERFGKMSFSAGWTFEYIKNNGVQNNMFPGGTLSEDDKNNAEKVNAEILKNRNDWRAKLHDSIQNYFTVKVRYVY